MIAYRICERKNDNLLTLFHGINRSRKMEINKWIKAEVKEVYDGSRLKSKKYLSGFHCLPTLEETRKFAKKFRAPRDLVIVKCEIMNPRPKSHSTSNVILGEWIKLLEIVEDIKISKK